MMTSPGRRLRCRRCLVTGGTGFIGTRVIERLRATDAEVVVLGEVNGSETDLTADLTDASAVAMAVRAVEPDLVMHLAADQVAPAGSEVAAWEVTVSGTANLLAALPDETGILLASSAEVYGVGAGPWCETRTPQPVSAEGISMLAAEQLVRLSAARGRRAVIVRPGTVYGPGQAPGRFIPEIISAILDGQPLRNDSGGQQFDLVYVEDVADGIMRAAAAAAADCPVFNLGTGVAPMLKEIIMEIRRLTGRDGTGTRELPGRAGEQAGGQLDPELALQQLGWRARTGWQEGLALTVAAASPRAAGL